jgi:hypothetical protein
MKERGLKTPFKHQLGALGLGHTLQRANNIRFAFESWASRHCTLQKPMGSQNHDTDYAVRTNVRCSSSPQRIHVSIGGFSDASRDASGLLAVFV